MSATWSCVRGSSFKPPAAALPTAAGPGVVPPPLSSSSLVLGASMLCGAHSTFDPFLGAAAAWGVAVAAVRSTLWPEK